MNNITSHILLSGLMLALSALSFVSCDDNKSYAELLVQEDKAVNRFLVDQHVIADIPEDSIFIYGEDAPYYQLDEEGNLYMQVINPGSGPKVVDDQMVYFRFLRYNLSYYKGNLDACYPEGNLNNVSSYNSFRYQNYTLPSSASWGAGLQTPLNYLPLNSEVRIVVKSQFGMTGELSAVTPYLYHIKYLKSIM